MGREERGGRKKEMRKNSGETTGKERQERKEKGNGKRGGGIVEKIE